MNAPADTQHLKTALLKRLSHASATEQARALAEGQVSASELLEHSIDRIERLNPAINALVVLDLERARADARAADAALARGERRPLLGVPVSVKENFDVAGLPTTVGSPAQTGNLAAQDSAAVAGLREAGAIVLGKSNVPLALADLQSYNAVYGLSRNPWDPARTPGGSSGGSAAALAAGFVALELGTDIGGSIRIPAHFTGVYGHKTSQGLISLLGTGLPAGRQGERDLAVAGPLARSAADLALALPLLLNRDPRQNKTWRATLPAPRHNRLSDFRLLLIDHWPGTSQSLSEQLVSQRLAQAVQAGGGQVTRVSELAPGLLPDLVASHTLYRSLLGSSLADPPTLSAGAQQRLAALQPDDHSANTDADTAWLRSFSLSHRDWLRLNEARLQLRAQWEALFEQFDLVLSPVAPLPAFEHNQQEPKDERHYPVAFAEGVRPVRFLDLFTWAGLPVLPGLPATSFPLGLDESGLPIGGQAVGPFLEDLTPIRFAELLEAQQPGFIVPPGWQSTD
ncbi:MAG: amidase [Curvibacter lanceolatus]|jgi:amidase|uniref:amidase n=1 Tax=Curvibacter lanceolatus TaxID=86182 RepID=UPI00036B20C5|nr:amidase [Curvibacter lanceolatus]MBV5294598.1 amidase [Curvibacter lanceolatus]